MNKADVLIVGGGVIGLATGIALLHANSQLKVIIAEKEKALGLHASGRNSGVLHSGFYYAPELLKARFCRDGNMELRKLSKRYGIAIREVGKVVVTKNAEENNQLIKLFDRGIANGVDLEILDASKLQFFEPLAKTHEHFIWSPTTAISDPAAILQAMLIEFQSHGGLIRYQTKVELKESKNEIHDSSYTFDAKYFVNAAGAQSDRISRAINVGIEYAMIPFIGLYRTTEESDLPLRRLVYPVPHPINPFLGTHFTLTLDRKVKIGPTAIPILGREHYSFFEGWSFLDMQQSLKALSTIFLMDSNNITNLVKTEFPKFRTSNLVKEVSELVPEAAHVPKWIKKQPGIRAQLVNLHSGKLEQDFVVKHKLNSTHVLNAVSPGWTSAISFGKYIANEILLRL